MCTIGFNPLLLKLVESPRSNSTLRALSDNNHCQRATRGAMYDFIPFYMIDLTTNFEHI